MYAALAARIVIFHRERAVHGLSLPVSVAVPEQGAGIPDPRADAHFRRGSAPGGGPADGLHVRRVNPAVNRGPAITYDMTEETPAGSATKPAGRPGTSGGTPFDVYFAPP